MGRLPLPALALLKLPTANFMWVVWQCKCNPTSRTLAVVRHSGFRKLSSWACERVNRYTSLEYLGAINESVDIPSINAEFEAITFLIEEHRHNL
ncbi:hypothetical protein L218DRAFT_962089 [Marasmius fiardii PR-910]|nr:hypothetical protein L218DRAFT_962089 [Marasmius fiardii PR-910]